MSVRVIEVDRAQVVRARVDRATACFYPRSGRVILVADGADFSAALEALIELADHVVPDDDDVTAVCQERSRLIE